MPSQYKLTVNSHNSTDVRSAVFSTEEDARAAITLFNWMDSDFGYGVTKVPGYLNGWHPDSTDMFVLETLSTHAGRIPCIKYARMKSLSGLKEAKDWVDEHFPAQ